MNEASALAVNCHTSLCIHSHPKRKRKERKYSGVSRDIAAYKAVPWLAKDVNNNAVLDEWTVYIAQNLAHLNGYPNLDTDAKEQFDILHYCTDRSGSVPHLVAHALHMLNMPISAVVKASFAAL